MRRPLQEPRKVAKPETMRQKQGGFTLFELLVVTTLVAVLASIAMPRYTEYLQRSHRVHAQAALLRAAQWLERAATAQGSYPERKAIPASVLSVEGDRYTLGFRSLDASSYRLQATTIGAQGSDPCGVFELNETGARAQIATSLVPAPLPTQACWNR